MGVEEINNQAKNNPLSKKDLEEQFVNKTKELGLKHTFTFEEAWEVAQEIRKKQDYRSKITSLHNDLVKVGGITGDELNEMNPVKHTFAGGCYIREIFNPANLLLVTKIHKKEHPFFLMKGKMSILTEDGVKTVEAPHNGITPPGTKRVIFTHEECVFITVHATDKTTPEEVEEDVIAKDFSDKDISLDDIEEISKALKLDKKMITKNNYGKNK
tara:strand:+ start:15860 stop:16501 length:642 start_codon:yes stop_codon:yes gene_type:complete